LLSKDPSVLTDLDDLVEPGAQIERRRQHRVQARTRTHELHILIKRRVAQRQHHPTIDHRPHQLACV